MKNMMRLTVMGIMVVFLLASCSKPQQALDEAKAAIEAAESDGANLYAAEELKALKDSLETAMEEIDTQGKKFFKSYGGSKDMLAKIKADAEALKTSIPERKEKVKTEAVTMIEEAKAAVEEAKTYLEQAPRGKGTKADIDAFTADLKGLEDSLAAVQETIDTQDYFGALDSAKTIKEKAASITDQIKQAIEKVKK